MLPRPGSRNFLESITGYAAQSERRQSSPSRNLNRPFHKSRVSFYKSSIPNEMPHRLCGFAIYIARPSRARGTNTYPDSFCYCLFNVHGARLYLSQTVSALLSN